MKIDTYSVLKAAKTKWNFLPFSPGLVGGHCIGVDPYYLTYKSIKLGYKPRVVLSGRKINDKMSKYVVKYLINQMNQNNISIKNSKILIMGLAFKENCADIRNTKVLDIYNELNKYKAKIEIYDPIVDKQQAIKEYNIKIIKKLYINYYDSVIIAVAHNLFKKMGINKIEKICKKNHIIFDVKNIFPKNNKNLKL